MVRRRFRRLLPLLRVLVLVLFAAGLVVQPVLAAAGEMHELAHDPSGTHAHGPHADDVAAEMAAAGEQHPDEARTLHVLLHFAHCCGAATAMLPIVKTLPAMSLSDPLAVAEKPMPLQARLSTPFKPPIFA